MTTTGVASRAAITDLIASILPFDDIERDHQQRALDWIRSDAGLYRDHRDPASSRMHLVAYFVPADPASGRILLVEHRKSGLLLPPGGHCEPGESPWQTVVRECAEELAVTAQPTPGFGPQPVFVTVTATRPMPGLPSHTDVSLWHVIAADPARVEVDPREFTGASWWDLDQLRRLPAHVTDPHLHRFCDKNMSPARGTG